MLGSNSGREIFTIGAKPPPLLIKHLPSTAAVTVDVSRDVSVSTFEHLLTMRIERHLPNRIITKFGRFNSRRGVRRENRTFIA